MGTASEIVIWMVLAALVGFATGWALRSVVANRARTRLSERLEEKRREAQELREELRHLRGDDEDVVHVPPARAGARAAGTTTTRSSSRRTRTRSRHLGATAEHDEVELGPLDEPEDDGRARRSAARRARCASTRSSGRTWRTRRASATTRRERAVSANRDELSPLALLRRSALAYPDRVAVRDGERTLSFAQLAERAWRLGNALRGSSASSPRSASRCSRSTGSSCSRRTSACPRPRGGAVRHQHAARASRGALHRRALRRAGAAARSRARGRGGPGRWSFPGCASCAWAPSTRRCSRAPRRRAPDWPDSEDRPISVDYTSGTTGTPKGVVYTHRGAYLGALAGLVETRLGPDSTISGRCPCSTATAGASAGACAGVGATSVVLRRPEPAAVWRELRAGATHLCAAPTVLIALLRAPRRGAPRPRRDVRRRRRAALADADRARARPSASGSSTCTA